MQKITLAPDKTVYKYRTSKQRPGKSKCSAVWKMQHAAKRSRGCTIGAGEKRLENGEQTRRVHWQLTAKRLSKLQVMHASTFWGLEDAGSKIGNAGGWGTGGRSCFLLQNCLFTSKQAIPVASAASWRKTMLSTWATLSSQSAISIATGPRNFYPLLRLKNTYSEFANIIIITATADCFNIISVSTVVSS